MKFQQVRYKADKDSNWAVGIACLNSGFGCSDVSFIVAADGSRLPSIWEYRLQEGPLCYIDMSYTG